MAGRVELILTVPAAGADPVERQSVEAFAGRGLDGDRYLLDEPVSGRAAAANLTLIPTTSIDHLRDLGHALTAHDIRRNLLVSDLDPAELIGVEFTIGEVRCRGVEQCEPCRYLERRTAEGVLKALVGRGGIRAEILTGGTIAVGDAVSV